MTELPRSSTLRCAHAFLCLHRYPCHETDASVDLLETNTKSSDVANLRSFNPFRCLFTNLHHAVENSCRNACCAQVRTSILPCARAATHAHLLFVYVVYLRTFVCFCAHGFAQRERARARIHSAEIQAASIHLSPFLTSIPDLRTFSFSSSPACQDKFRERGQEHCVGT